MPDTAYCPDCATRQVVEETSTEGHMERRGEVEYQVTHLACGHTLQGPGHVVCAAPGAPYAGPGVAVAATTRARDLRAARARQEQLDNPWGEDR